MKPSLRLLPRSWPERLRLKRAVAHLQISLGPLGCAGFVEWPANLFVEHHVRWNGQRLIHAQGVVPPETVKINLAISTMGLQMMGLRDALRMDETLSIPAHMMLNEEFRRPLDEARATQGTKAYLQMRDGPFQPEPFGPRARKKTE